MKCLGCCWHCCNSFCVACRILPSIDGSRLFCHYSCYLRVVCSKRQDLNLIEEYGHPHCILNLQFCANNFFAKFKSMLYVFIDESGDLGFAKKSTKYYVIASVETRDLVVPSRIIKRVRKTLGKKEENHCGFMKIFKFLSLSSN